MIKTHTFSATLSPSSCRASIAHSGAVLVAGTCNLHNLERTNHESLFKKLHTDICY